MRLLFDKAKWTIDMDGAWLMINTDLPQAKQFCSDMVDDKKYSAELKQDKNKRSLDANAYFWVMCGKLASKLGMAKEAVYRELIKGVGDNFEIVPIKDEAVDKWISNWQSKGIGWVCDTLGESKLNGYTNIITYYGSSTYDTKQMSQLINLLVQECKDQDIETMTPAELSLLLGGWDEQN